MSVVVINVLTVPPSGGGVLEERFASRAGLVEGAEGFEGFQLLRPTEGTDKYLVVTRWREHSDFQRWLESAEFGRGHAQAEAAALWKWDLPRLGHLASRPSAPSRCGSRPDALQRRKRWRIEYWVRQNSRHSPENNCRSCCKPSGAKKSDRTPTPSSPREPYLFL